MKIKPQWILLLVFFGVMQVVATAAYQTPGSGLTYSLASLSAAAGADLVSSPDGFLLNGRVKVSAGDTLLTTDEVILVGEFDPDECPSLIVEGNVQATSLTIRLHPSVPSSKPQSRGISILRNGPPASSGNAVFTGCVFEELQPALMVSRDAEVSVHNSQFVNCSMGIGSFAAGRITLRDTTLTSSPLTLSGSFLDMESCRIEHIGCNFLESLAGTRVVDCTFVNTRDFALMFVDDTQAVATDNRFVNCQVGLGFQGDTTITASGNEILDSELSGVISFDTAAPVLRGNTIHNTTPPPSAPTGTWRAAVHVFDASAPDFGRIGDDGQNSIRETTGLLVYHAGNELVEMIGNDWGVALDSEVENLLYHFPDDDTDADASEFRSGTIHFFESQVISEVHGFIFY